MSKIQINELNLNASEFNTLSKDETTEVVGGGYYGYGYYAPYYSYYSSYSSDNDFAVVNQGNDNSTQQVSFGGYYGNTGNSNYTGQGNYAHISQ